MESSLFRYHGNFAERNSIEEIDFSVRLAR